MEAADEFVALRHFLVAVQPEEGSFPGRFLSDAGFDEKGHGGPWAAAQHAPPQFFQGRIVVMLQHQVVDIGDDHGSRLLRWESRLQ